MEKAPLLTNIPPSSGVYLFKNRQLKILYVGKAVNLARRVKQYFVAGEALGEKTRALVSQISQIETIRTANEFDALLLEARLIREFQPRYNIVARDDKSPIYVCLTLSEELPRVLLLRKSSLPKARAGGPTIFGPFQSATVTRQLLRTVRRIIPFCTQKIRDGRPCFYTHLSLCRPCPSVIAKMKPGEEREHNRLEYRQHILQLKALLSGKERGLRLTLNRQMQQLAKQNQFEEASLLKQQIQGLLGIETARFDPSLYLTRSQLIEDAAGQELASLREVLSPYFPKLPVLSRIECIDISNLGGREATGSLVVLANGLSDTGQYRKFRISRADTPNDTAMIAEVISRRMRHRDWPLPQLLVVDGGRGQVSAALTSLKTLGLKTPVIGLSKRFEEIVVPKTGGFKVLRLPLAAPAIHLLQRIRDEAHRFARNYHLLLRARAFREV